MTTLFQRTATDWADLGGLDTAREIAQQPALWRALAADLAARFWAPAWPIRRNA